MLPKHPNPDKLLQLLNRQKKISKKVSKDFKIKFVYPELPNRRNTHSKQSCKISKIFRKKVCLFSSSKKTNFIFTILWFRHLDFLFWIYIFKKLFVITWWDLRWVEYMPPHRKTIPRSSPAWSMWRHVDGRKGGDSNSLKADMSWTEVDMGDETDNTKKPKPLL